MSFLPAFDLCIAKRVSKKWKTLCEKVFNGKCSSQKAFETTEELRTAVKQYCGYDPNTRTQYGKTFIYYSIEKAIRNFEKMVCTYGPIGK